jgi:hypothetical protein
MTKLRPLSSRAELKPFGISRLTRRRSMTKHCLFVLLARFLKIVTECTPAPRHLRVSFPDPTPDSGPVLPITPSDTQTRTPPATTSIQSAFRIASQSFTRVSLQPPQIASSSRKTHKSLPTLQPCKKCFCFHHAIAGSVRRCRTPNSASPCCPPALMASYESHPRNPRLSARTATRQFNYRAVTPRKLPSPKTSFFSTNPHISAPQLSAPFLQTHQEQRALDENARSLPTPMHFSSRAAPARIKKPADETSAGVKGPKSPSD